jgi:BirA family biotin operon repressor/biotin-[acetyl-CoA-carboxylase] ligase
MASPEDALADYRDLCATLGERVRVERNDAEALEGEATEITDSGALVVSTPSGPVTVAAGDVVHLRPGA